MERRTNIVLDEKLVAKVMKKAGVTTMKAAVDAALRAYVAPPARVPSPRPEVDYSALLSLEGAGLIADDYDPKEPYGLRAEWPARVPETVRGRSPSSRKDLVTKRRPARTSAAAKS